MMNLIKLLLLLMPLQAFAGVTPGTIDVRLYDSAGNSITSSAGGLTTSTTISSGSLTCNAGTNLNTSALALDATLTTLSGKFGSIGQQTMANSAPVVLSSNQSSIPVTGTFFQATQPVSGTFFQATQPVSLAANQSVNVAQINGITPLMGNGVTGTGSQRVTIASDNTAFSVNQGGAPWSQNITQFGGVALSTGTGASGTGIPRVTVANDSAVIAGGNVASLAADSGNPVKAGAVFNTTLPAPASGNRVDLQANKFGELVVRHRNKFTNLTGAATTTVKSGTGVLAGIALNNGTASSIITIYDNTAGSGTIIMKLAPGSVSQFGSVYMGIDAEFSTGLTVVTTVASTDITLFYQ